MPLMDFRSLLDGLPYLISLRGRNVTFRGGLDLIAIASHSTLEEVYIECDGRWYGWIQSYAIKFPIGV